MHSLCSHYSTPLMNFIQPNHYHAE